MTICPYCEGYDAQDARATEGTTCECLITVCGHDLSPVLDDAPPCEVCDRCQSCCACPDNDFRAGLRGE